jgi:thioredoxin reductase
MTVPVPAADLHTVIIGGGPAGLSAAYELSRLGSHSTILEADKVVGGLARTAEYKGYLFDIGGTDSSPNGTRSIRFGRRYSVSGYSLAPDCREYFIGGSSSTIR